MALITCPECGSTVSDKAASCPKCGCPISGGAGNAAKDVQIKFPVYQGHIFNNKCIVLKHGSEIGRCNQGETLTIPCTETMTITIKMQGFTNTIEQTVSPGDKYKVDYKAGFALPKIYATKVDVIM